MRFHLNYLLVGYRNGKLSACFCSSLAFEAVEWCQDSRKVDLDLRERYRC